MMPSLRIIAGVALASVLASTAFAAKATSDLTPPPKRQASVELAQKLAQRTAPAPVPADLPSPFNPSGFDKPEGGDQKQDTVTPGPATAPTPAPVAPTDRETLESLAARIPSTGTIERGGKLQLTIASNPPRRLQVGDSFVVSLNNQDYELELVAIERTTFTLRYRGVEYTRPIKLAR